MIILTWRNMRQILLQTIVACILCITAALPSRAHEVIPAVADVELYWTYANINIRLNAEAILAGIDLANVSDTDDADQADAYTQLRAFSAAQLSERIMENWPIISQNITAINQENTRLKLELVELDVQDADPELPRFTTLYISTIDEAEPLSNGAELGVLLDGLRLGWAREYGGLVVRQIGPENGLTEYLENGALSQEMLRLGAVEPKTAWETFFEYIPIGFDHIIPKGLDHILFVLGLFFLAAGFRALIWQISAFTVAHTITLAAGALGWVVVAPSVVEPLIAASIVFIAVENVLSNRLHTWRPLVVFCFGLLHGLGFASVLGEFGLPRDQFIPALIGFNLGVEFGQIVVIIIAFLLVGLAFRKRAWYRGRIAIPASMMIGLIGAWWFFERVFL